MAKGMYAVVNKTVPTYDTTSNTISLTSSNVSTVFTVKNDSYYFYWSGSSLYSSNSGDSYHGTTAKTTWTALYDMTVSLSYSVSSESNYDKLKITANNVTDVTVSGSVSNTYNCSLKKGQTLVFEYSKDGSQSSGSDRGTISNVSVTYTVQTQTGSETKTLTSKIKKTYCVIGGVTKQVKKIYAVVGGVTRLVWSGSAQLNLYGTISNISYRSDGGSAVAGDLAIFFGGDDGGDISNGYAKRGDYLNASLTNGTFSLTYGIGSTTGASVGGYCKAGSAAIFAGGLLTGSGYEQSIVQAIDSSATQRTVASMNEGNSSMKGVSAGQYAYFTGGQYRDGGTGWNTRGRTYIFMPSGTYNYSWQSWNSGVISISNRIQGWGHAGNYAVFVPRYCNNAVAYIQGGSETKLSLATQISSTGCSSSTKDHVIIQNGTLGLQPLAWNSSLSATTVASLLWSPSTAVLPTLNGCAIFHGGSKVPDTYSDYYIGAQMYDESLTLTVKEDTSQKKYGSPYQVGAVAGGKYGIIPWHASKASPSAQVFTVN